MQENRTLGSAVFDLTLAKEAERANVAFQEVIDNPERFPKLYAAAQLAEDLNVYGHDAKRDPKTGEWIQQGIGAGANINVNHLAALRKAERLGQERPGTYEKECARIWKLYPEVAKRLNLQPAERA